MIESEEMLSAKRGDSFDEELAVNLGDFFSREEVVHGMPPQKNNKFWFYKF